MRILLGLVCLVPLACSSPVSASSATAEPASAAAAPEAAAEPAAKAGPDAEVREQIAYFAGGCFWGVEHYLEQMDGVASVESGYMGGHIESPTYQQVSSQTSGHLETVEVRFDANRVSYYDVAKRFFEIHDPTQANGQGPDIGPEYLSVVFYADDAQKKDTETLIGLLRERGYDVVTTVRKAEKFWPAEDYHQNYYANSGKKPYCHARVRRFDD